MPLTIWEPARYAAGFAHDGNGRPINGELAAAPHDKDAKVCEVCAFEGWKEVHFCDCGEFEVTTADVAPEHIKRGNFVNFDGDFFIIEDYEWNIIDGEYVCTFSGRDFWKFPDSEISRRFIGMRYGESGLTGAWMMNEINRFFFFVTLQAGWFRDQRRFPTIRQNEAGLFDLTTDATNAGGFASKSAGIQVASNIMSYGAEWRMFANLLQCGVRFGVAFNESKGLFEVLPMIYDGQDRGVVINSRDAGVSDFKYGFSGRGEVNAVYSVFKDNAGYKYEYNERHYENDGFSSIWGIPSSLVDEPDPRVSSVNAVNADDAKNFAERLVTFSEAFTDLGDVPSEVDAAVTSNMANPNDYHFYEIENWATAEMEKSLVSPTVSFEFAYNDGGAYKFGKHFNIGDKITIVDDYLGVSSIQQLTTVKTVYEAGGKGYEFEFANQRIRQSDVLKRRLYEVNRRTLTRGIL